MPSLYGLARPLLAALDPETAHQLTLRALALGLGPRADTPDPPALAQTVFGISFPNPVGLAAGFDKNAEVPAAMLRLGFGFVETGTVTPLPQDGKPRPRLFRLERDGAVINRMGFNNEGLPAVRDHLARQSGRPGIVAANVGANADSVDKIGDYIRGLEELGALAAYLTVNISSPNTPGLRGLQAREPLERLVNALVTTRARDGLTTPILLKIAPDLDDDELAAVVETALAYSLEGLIVSNTTIARPKLQSRHAGEVGGLSGKPLFQTSTEKLRQVAKLAAGRLVLIGVGGISSGADAYAKIRAGASLVQLYTALAFQGPALVTEIKRDLLTLMTRDGFTSIAEAVGADFKGTKT